MALMQAGRFSAAEWATGLGSAIARAQAAGDPDDGSTYYWHVLNALEALAFEKTFATPWPRARRLGGRPTPARRTASCPAAPGRVVNR
jgi:hypothetical protein